MELRRTSSFPTGSRQPELDDEVLVRGSRGRRLVCRQCSALITTDAARTEVEGHHVHTRTNPHGYSFTFGCFSEAPGAREAGRPTAEHSWFSGHRWSFSLCGGCGTHLGWYFRPASGVGFFGLILERLHTEESDDVS